MEQWEETFPIEATQMPTGPFWKDSKGHLVIPPDRDLKQDIMCEWHDRPLAGHPGRDETTCCINKSYFWPGAQTWVDQYIKGCATCQQNKNLIHCLKTLMFWITSLPNAKPFSQVAMDLITGLPNSKGNDVILTIVDHGCSHSAIFLPCTTTITGPQIAKLYLNHIFRWFGLPEKVISDRDPRFTSHFGRSLTKELGIHQNLSTAFHPQTDSISKHKNQWVEQYLRLIMANQSDWSDWLAVATLVHNNSANAMTGFPPSQLLVGWEPPLTPEQGTKSNNLMAEQHAENLQNNRTLAIEALNKVAQKNSLTDA